MQLTSLKRRAVALMKDNRLEEARGTLISLCEGAPADAEALQLLSTVHGMLGGMDEAKACARRAIGINPDGAAAYISLGNILQAEGWLEEAADNYHRAIALDPSLINAYCNLGSILISQNNYGEAARIHQLALRLQPDDGQLNALKQQISSLLRRGALDEARVVLLDLCEAAPSDAESWYLLSCAAGRLGNLSESADCSRRAITLKPNYAQAHVNLGNVLAAKGSPEEAVESYRNALELDAALVAAHNNLGNALCTMGRYDEASESYHKALALCPDLEGPYFSLGNIEHSRGRLESAVQHYREAIRINGAYAPAYNNLGAALYALGDGKGAIDTLLKAIELQPTNAQTYCLLGRAMKKNSQLEKATLMLEHALRLDPDLVEAHRALADTLILKGRPKEAYDMYQKALELQPELEEIHSSLILSMHYVPEFSEDDVLQVSMQWAARHALRRSRLPPVVRAPERSRRLRIGYVSGDLHHHPVGFFIEAVLACHDRSNFEIFCYYNHVVGGEHNALLKQSADHWRDVPYQSAQELACTVRGDSVDILVDLAGHTGRSGLAACAHRPAPIQATWLGYFATTGVDALDYLIADWHVIPAGQEQNYVEEVVRLPDSYLCFSAPNYPIDPSPLPALPNGQITFGCFHNASKLTPSTIACWAKILHALPNARLYFKYLAYGNQEVCRRYSALFAEQGIGSDRLLFAGFSPRDELLKAYREVDIALDPFPYCGGTTTVEALWMGVPVISRRGDRFSHRVGVSILKTVGLDEFLVDTEAEYVEKTVALASDITRLADLRKKLRTRLMDSPICDGPRFTRNLEAIYRTMWHRWCNAHER